MKRQIRSLNVGVHYWKAMVFFAVFICTALLLVQTIPASGADSIDFATAIEKVAQSAIPAVAHIEVTERQEVANPLAPFEDDPFFHYFFGNRNMPKKFQREVVGLGTGMLIDAEGHILTNNHVVAGATKIHVTLPDGRQYSDKSVKLIGTDSKTDLAVIQITAKEPFPYLPLGDSDKVGVGQWVVAIGHPRGLDQTVTQGIISAKHRTGISDPGGYQDFLQTDAAINPGNSGGPLLNLQGEVVGVNAAIMSQSGGFEGLGFAIPSNMASHVAKELIARGKVVRGWLGVSIQNMTPEIAKSFDVSSTKGALVVEVVKDGPAARSGINRGDVIVGFQGKPVDDSGSLRNMAALAPIGQDVTVTIMRNGSRQDVTVKVASEAEQVKTLAASIKEKFGISVRPLTPKELDRAGLTSRQGVAVVSVTPNSPFGRAGFEVGDYILQIDKHDVNGPEGLAALLTSLPGNQKISVLAADHKSGQVGYVEVAVP